MTGLLVEESRTLRMVDRMSNIGLTGLIERPDFLGILLYYTSARELQESAFLQKLPVCRLNGAK